MATKKRIPKTQDHTPSFLEQELKLKASLISWTSLKRNYLYWVEHEAPILTIPVIWQRWPCTLSAYPLSQKKTRSAIIFICSSRSIIHHQILTLSILFLVCVCSAKQNISNLMIQVSLASSGPISYLWYCQKRRCGLYCKRLIY